MFDPEIVKQDFPIFKRHIHADKPLVYLDSAATSQKPQSIIDSFVGYYTQHNANVHRGIHVLGDESTKLFSESRKTIASFFGADAYELLLVRNTTEAINTIAYTWGQQHLKKHDVVLTTVMEHHSNLVPWQELAKRTGCTVEYISVMSDGLLDMKDLERQLTKKVKLVAVTHISNALGTKNPIKEIIQRSHAVGAKVLIDGAQSAPHLPIDFHALKADFYAFSGHKMLGPMGIGGLLVKKEVLDTMDPFFFGGGMINEVSLEETSFSELPDKFIAGTPDVAGTVGLAAACTYLLTLGMDHVLNHDHEIVSYAMEKLSHLSQLRIVGPLDAKYRVGSVAFLYEGVHAHDVAQVLDSEGVAVRSGHHCTMPLHRKFGWAATTRASFNVYTTKQDIDMLVAALGKVKNVFGK